MNGSADIPDTPIRFSLLTEAQISEIKNAALQLMARTGFEVHHREARRLLKQAGARIEDQRVKVPADIVEACIDSAPKGFWIFDRQGQPAMHVTGRKSYHGCSTGSHNTKDALTGEIHETRLLDIARGAKLCDALPGIEFVMPMGSAQDVAPHAAQELHEFQAIVTNTTKPVVMLSYSTRAFELVYEMAAAVAGGLENLQRKPFLLAYPETITPLVFPQEPVQRILFAACLGMPVLCSPAAQMGASGPVTLAGSLALIVAESLMCLTLAQLSRPGTPCFLAGGVIPFDMRHGSLSTGGPELSLGKIALAEIGRSLGLPSWGTAGCSDAKLVDGQAGVEGTFSILAQNLGGVNLIHDVGYLDSGMVCSAEMLVLGHETIGMTRRLMRGFDIDTESLALDLIDSIGPGGNFLQTEHTLANFRRELWQPSLMAREHYDKWEDQGRKAIDQKIREKIRAILETHAVKPLSGKTGAELERIKRKGSQELA